jgi:plastocyanin
VEKKITVGDNYFSPKKVTIEPGTTVIWTNKGTAIHDVMQDDPLDESKPHIPEAMKDFSSDVLRSGDIHVVLFSEPGTYYYHCHFHGGPQRGQWGVITVKD